MENMSEDKGEKLIEKINSSGFPLQLAVENIVLQHCSSKWEVLFTEHRWVMPKNIGEFGLEPSDEKLVGFADLVLYWRNEHTGKGCILNVECKKANNEGDFVFLVPSTYAIDEQKCKSFLVRRGVRHQRDFGVKHRFDQQEWVQTSANPGSYVSSTAIVNINGEKLLDRFASPLSISTEAIALEARNSLVGEDYTEIYFFNVLVTNKKLWTCSYDSNQLDLQNGEIGSLTHESFRFVPWIRYDKQVASTELQRQTSSTPMQHYRELGERKERTIFVVNSSWLQKFLNEFDFDLAT